MCWPHEVPTSEGKMPRRDPFDLSSTRQCPPDDERLTPGTLIDGGPQRSRAAGRNDGAWCAVRCAGCPATGETSRYGSCRPSTSGRPWVVGDDCGIFISAAPSVFEVGASGFWELARHAKASVAAGQAREGLEAVNSALQRAVGSGSDIAAAAEFAAIAFARQGMITNVGPLTFPSRLAP
jgi:hypothetical protein